MAFSGELTDRSVAELLNDAAESRWSGKLRLSYREGEGVVLFDRGLIGYAASSALRETFGSILMAQKKITQVQLEQALESQRTLSRRSLGSILVESGTLTQEAMNEAVRLQVQRALADLMSWEGGRYEFQPMVVAGGDYVSLPLAEVLPAERVPEAGTSEPLAAEIRDAGRPPRQDQEAESRLLLFRQMALEVRSPAFTGEMVSRVLDMASSVVSRAVLFSCRAEGFFGIGQSGVEIEGANADEVARSLVIPADTMSILRDASETRATARQTLRKEGGDALLVAELGGRTPSQGLAAPIVVNNRVMVVLYGDNLPEDRPIGSILELELLMIQAGMSVENNLLQKRLQHYETLSEGQGDSGGEADSEAPVEGGSR